ncbi:MAG: hypothetical protein NTV87_03525 [Ignavibacteriae bacterium]|nr:hypothetical protein [Ignavibacteriota bacterium]
MALPLSDSATFSQHYEEELHNMESYLIRIMNTQKMIVSTVKDDDY